MKILAIIDVAAGAPMDKIRGSLLDELRGSWGLFAQGVLREAYTTPNPARVVFVLEAASADEARAALGKLPLVAEGLFAVELVELHPFVNWSRLFAG